MVELAARIEALQSRMTALRTRLAEAATAQGKLVELTTIGFEKIPESQVAACYDMLSQMLRNAIEHGIETPAQRRAVGKPATVHGRRRLVAVNYEGHQSQCYVAMSWRDLDGRTASLVRGRLLIAEKRQLDRLDALWTTQYGIVLSAKLGAVAGFNGEAIRSLDVKLGRKGGQIRSFSMK